MGSDHQLNRCLREGETVKKHNSQRHVGSTPDDDDDWTEEEKLAKIQGGLVAQCGSETSKIQLNDYKCG